MDNLFGTDGIRGLAQIEIKPDLFWDLGTFLSLKANGPIMIGYDTRNTSYLYKNILSSAIISFGQDVLDIGVVTTPCLAYLCKIKKPSFAIMITASHNPYQYNGFKIFDSVGHKIDVLLQEEISSYLLNKNSHPNFYPVKIGNILDKSSWVDLYIDHIISSYKFTSILNMKMILDPGNGGGYKIIKKCFDKLGFKNIIYRGDTPDGFNINDDVGATHIDSLKEVMKKEHINIGLALDGDGDRFGGILFDKKLDGESLTYLLILDNYERFSSGIVSTTETNRSLIRTLLHYQIPYYESAVGDINVYNLMMKTGVKYGFESSGHILIDDSYSDGIVSMLLFLKLFEKNSDKTIEDIKKLKLNHLLRLTYQVDDKKVFAYKFSYSKEKGLIKECLKAGGRITLRESGTEDILRVNIESRSKQGIRKAKKIFDEFYEENKCVE